MESSKDIKTYQDRPGVSNYGRILIVDDDADVSTVLFDSLLENGYQVVKCSSGPEALEALREQNFDLLLADLQMPEMDGIALLRDAQKIDPLLVGIIITAHGTLESAVEALKLGAFDYVLKPLRLKELLLTVSRAMEVHRLRDSEKKYRAIVEDQTELICRFLPGGIITFANEPYCRYFDRNREDLIGQNFISFVIERDRQSVLQTLAAINEENPAVTIEYRVMKANGETRWQRWTNRLIVDDKKYAEFISVGRDITEHKEAEEAVKTERRRLYDVLETLPAYVVLLSPDYHVPFANRFFRERFGESRGKRCFEYLFHRNAPCEICETYTVLKTNVPHRWEWTGPDGRNYDIYDFPFVDTDGSRLILEMGIDITEHKRSEKMLRESEEKYRDLFDNAHDMIQSVAPDGRFVLVNNSWLKTMGYTRDELPALTFLDVLHPCSKQHCMTAFQKVISGESMNNLEAVFVTKDGKKIDVEGNVSAHTIDGKVVVSHGIFRDVTERNRAKEAIEKLAYYDALTELPNRSLFTDRLTQTIAGGEYRKRVIGVVVLNIDRFRLINEAFGPSICDMVLKDIAKRLSSSVREGDTVGRFGGDEFAIVLADVATTEDIILIAEKIIRLLSSATEIDDKEIVTTASVGLSLYPNDGNDSQSLIQNAYVAMARAKEQGGNNYKFYTVDMNTRASEFVSMGKDLFNALKNDEYVLHYQPYFDLNTRKIVGMEALIRWRNEKGEMVPPGKFIPILEETKMIIDVGEWVLRTAMGQIKEWQNNGYDVVPVSVNLSLVQFRQKELATVIRKTIEECGYYPSLLILEITESAFIEDIKLTESVLNRLKDMGISISIDDFGVGYSSLNYLRRFPIDSLKIDRSFIRDVVTDPDSASIVMAVINMAHTLGLKIVAEGIETEEQWKFLRLLKCDMGQGFYFSKALPAENAKEFLI